MKQASDELSLEFNRLIERAEQISADVGDEVEEILALDDTHLLSAVEVKDLLDKVVKAVERRIAVVGDRKRMATKLQALVDELVQAREKIALPLAAENGNVELIEMKGIKPRPVKPTPVFHTREVPLMEGYVRTRDINLWDSNERIEIHLQQFNRKHGRKPNPQELLDIMFCHLKLDGVPEEDQFKIPPLARSIAANGLRKPPIISRTGKLLDGNRRVAACYYILTSDEFSIEQKQRVEYIMMWQLTEHSDSEDEDAIIVSLNFEDDHKQKWPEYVKARKVYEQWEAAIATDPNASPRRLLEIRREISKRFALGPDVADVTRYIKMVTGANEFEDYHIATKKRDRYEVKHKASEYFQYFDELAKGESPGKLAYELGKKEEFKHLVFELLYTDKFKNWKQIRDLRFIVDNDEARGILNDAAAVNWRTKEELEDVQEKVEDALAMGRTKQAEQRLLGKNTRIETFVHWLLDLPIGAFQDPNQIKPENIRRLHNALKFVDNIIGQQLFPAPEVERE